MILAIGVVASVVFYAKEYMLSDKDNILASFDEKNEEDDVNVGELSDDRAADADTGDAADAGEKEPLTVKLSDEDRAFIEGIVRSTVRDELYKISREEGYLENAFSQAAELAAEEASKNAGKVNINTADIAELTTLDGIGEKRAGEIISYREENGGFDSIEELMNIKGIKQAAFDKIKDKIYV